MADLNIRFPHVVEDYTLDMLALRLGIVANPDVGEPPLHECIAPIQNQFVM